MTPRDGLLTAYAHNPSSPMEKTIGRPKGKATTSRGASKRPATTKKKGGTSSATRRRNPSLSATAKATFGVALALAAGAVVAEQVTRLTDRAGAKLPAGVRTAAAVGVPAVIGVICAASKKPIVRNMGLGMATTSVANAVSALTSAASTASAIANGAKGGVGRLPSGSRPALQAPGAARTNSHGAGLAQLARAV